MLNTDLREKYPSEQKNLFGLDIVDKLKEHYHAQEINVNLGSIELADLFMHPFLLYDSSGNKVSPVSSTRSLKDSNKHSEKNWNNNSIQGNSFSSKNSIPGFLRKFLTSCSATSTNRQSESENFYNYNGNARQQSFHHNFYANKEEKKNDEKNKFSIVSDPYDNELGQYTYYCHEDYNGEKVEYRKSKLIPLNEGEKIEEEGDDLDSVTTPISTSQMKSEFRDRKFEYGKDRGYAKILMKYKRKTMAQPVIQQLTVLEEASISMEQSAEMKSGESPTHRSEHKKNEPSEKLYEEKASLHQYRRQQTEDHYQRVSINEEVHRINIDTHYD